MVNAGEWMVNAGEWRKASGGGMVNGEWRRNEWRKASGGGMLWRHVDSFVECRDKSESRWGQIDTKRSPCDARAAFSEEICKIAVFCLLYRYSHQGVQVHISRLRAGLTTSDPVLFLSDRCRDRPSTRDRVAPLKMPDQAEPSARPEASAPPDLREQLAALTEVIKQQSVLLQRIYEIITQWSGVETGASVQQALLVGHGVTPVQERTMAPGRAKTGSALFQMMEDRRVVDVR
uniref:Uncharacterized protein n=1 Tax=Ananas comosus var. bracteatus TaxID=296719 RepID=A0A6V7NSZ1_ANACO|nr:unnamed protein product [Ananas comosus var. bracteatus]